MNTFARQATIFGMLLLCLTGARPAQGQLVDDVLIRYARMHISEAIVGGRTVAPKFNRHFFQVEAGKGAFTAGMIYQLARRAPGETAGKNEDGLMVTLGHNKYLSGRLRFETRARIGLSGGTNAGQPLYAADTDIQFSLVGAMPDGLGSIGMQPIFPSVYAGSILNKYGRVQMIAGLGAWWNRIGLYLTGYHALNGVSDPMNAPQHADRAFAFLKNTGWSLGWTYEYKDVKLWLKKNFAVTNSGNDLTFSLQYRLFFFDEVAL